MKEMGQSMDILNFILGLIGTLTGITGTWFAFHACRQHLTIDRSEMWSDGYKVINHSLRPIPIQKVVLLVKSGTDFVPSNPPPEIRGLILPGSLAPESSFEVDWANARQIVEVCLQRETKLEIYTQTGKVFRRVHKQQSIKRQA
jgi:hypothetical protein